MENNIQTMIKLTKDDVKQIPEEVNAVIVDIKRTIASDALKGDLEKPEQPYLQIFVKNDQYNISFIENVPYYEGEALTSNTKLGKLINFYEDIQIGKLVKLRKNAKGYWGVSIS